MDCMYYIFVTLEDYPILEMNINQIVLLPNSIHHSLSIQSTSQVTSQVIGNISLISYCFIISSFIVSITKCSVLTLFQDDSGKLFDSFIPIDGGVLHFNGFKNQSFSKRWIKVLSASQSFIDKLPSSVRSYDQEKSLLLKIAHIFG